jgi:sulfite reductase alpha subunit-like flavoprotein
LLCAGRSALEVLQDFPSATPPLQWLLGCLPRLQPRRFSAASSLLARPACVDLLVAVVEWATPGRRRRRGLCSSWLAGLPEGATVPVWAERGALRMPADPGVPLILVGPGTGVAPFRAVLQERAAQRQRGLAPPPAPCVLAFGCRSAAADFYCRGEWEEMREGGTLGGAGGGLLVAFSRDQEAKVYVTHRIREHGGELWAALAGGAAVFVAGSADRMPADVAAAFRDVAAQHGGMAEDEAARFVKRMEAAGRYQVEAWS